LSRPDFEFLFQYFRDGFTKLLLVTTFPLCHICYSWKHTFLELVKDVRSRSFTHVLKYFDTRSSSISKRDISCLAWEGLQIKSVRLKLYFLTLISTSILCLRISLHNFRNRYKEVGQT
jgi:hypothetical protein